MAKAREPKILTLDTETIDLDGALKRIAIYDGVEPTYGYTFSEVLSKIEWYYEQDYMPHIYIHNLDFDARKIPEIFEQGNVVWARTKKIGTKYAKISCRKYTIHDSFKILPFSLKKLSNDFGLEHGKLDLWEEVQKVYPGQYKDHVDFLNRCDRDDELYIRYLGYDVISLYELIYKLMDVSGLTEKEFCGILSTASLSKYLLKNGYKGTLFKDPDRDKTDYEILSACKAWSSQKTMRGAEITYQECEYKMREGFYGGRTEVFTPVLAEQRDNAGNKIITGYHYDVNSLYPSVMIDNDFPIGYPDFRTGHKSIKYHFERWMKYHEGLGFIKATVYVPSQKIPPLPCKMGKLVFVTGYINGTWTYNELEYAIKHCGVEVVEYQEQIHFVRTFKVFHRFVSTFYEMKVQGKKEKNASLTAFAKLILNTAYGWTVLRRDDKTALRDMKDIEKWKDDPRFIYANQEIGYFEIFDTVISDSIQVQIGAYVTSYARLVLLDALRHMSEVGDVYYCDTDSIVCSHPMPPEMVDKTALGKWDLEGQLYSGLFLQPKVYTEQKVDGPDTIKFKGITKQRQAELDAKFYQGIYDRLKRGDNEWVTIETGRKTLPSLSVAQKTNTDPNQFKVTDKRLNLGAIQKRQFDYDENVSIPWHMDTIEKFETFSFSSFHNPPDGPNLFGG